MPVSFNEYEVVELVAQGSTGTVYRARHAGLDRDAAIKELSAELRRLPGFVERYRGEAEMLAGLDHPNVVAVYDYVEQPDRVWIVEEWVPGASVEAILAAHGRLSPEQAVGVMRGALMGLAHAHDRGLVHRDIAPGNILAEMAGTAKLVDFGLAAPVGVGSAQGTPAYISPEAARGDWVTKSSDVYSAAAVLFALLSGRPPFAAADVPSMLRRHIEDPAPALSGHGSELADVLTRAMAKDPAMRPTDAQAFLAELEEAAQKHFGAGWLSRASIAALVGATVAGGAVVAAGASAGVAASAPAAVVDVAAAGAGALRAAAGTAPKAGLLGMSAAVVAGVAAAAVLVLGGGAFAAVKIAGPGSDGSKTKAKSPAAVASARAAVLKATAPTGIYTLRAVLVSSTYKGDKPGSVTEQSFAVSLACTAKSCTGASAAGAGTDTWDGSSLSLGQAPPEITSGLCIDAGGRPVPGSHFKSTTTRAASPLRPSGSSGASGPPATFTGTVDFKTTYSELKGNCQNLVNTSHYTVTLTRK